MAPSNLDRLMSLAYRELHKLAKHYMEHQRPGHILQTTAVIHEAYVKLAAHPDCEWENREHFLIVASRAMRQVLVDYARAKQASKRGGAVQFVELDDDVAVSPERSTELMALDEALSAMAKLYPRQSQVVDMHYFGGLTLEETAGILKLSPDTVLRDLRFAKAWLRRKLRPEAP
jgi:RNA polymerase sigma-70 factor (ECF subfamily)